MSKLDGYYVETVVITTVREKVRALSSGRSIEAGDITRFTARANAKAADLSGLESALETAMLTAYEAEGRYVPAVIRNEAARLAVAGTDDDGSR